MDAVPMDTTCEMPPPTRRSHRRKARRIQDFQSFSPCSHAPAATLLEAPVDGAPVPPPHTPIRVGRPRRDREMDFQMEGSDSDHSNDSSDADLCLNFDQYGYFAATPTRSPASSVIPTQQRLEDTNGRRTAAGSNVSTEHPATPPSSTRRDQCALGFLFGLVLTFGLVELVAGLVTDSLALISDSFHMGGDALSLCIGLVAIRMAQRKATYERSYGWQRSETIGGLINAVLLLSLCFYTTMEALVRLADPPVVRQPWILLGVGMAGLAVNVVGLLLFCSHRTLHAHAHSHHDHDGHGHHDHGHDHSETTIANDVVDAEVANDPDSAAAHPRNGHADNLNLHGVFLHILSDAFGSILVIVVALLNLFVPPAADGSAVTWVRYMDPVISLLFMAFIARSAVPLLRQSWHVLMQSAPADVNVETLHQQLQNVPGVHDVHELHVWQMGGAHRIATAHVTVDSSRLISVRRLQNTLGKVQLVFHAAGVFRTAIQPEFCRRTQQHIPDGACTTSTTSTLATGPERHHTDKFLCHPYGS